MNIDLDKMAKLKKSGFKQCFFHVCETEDLLQIEKMFLTMDIKTRLDSEMLCAGLFAGFLAEKSKTVNTVFDMASKLNIVLKKEDLAPIFNLLIERGNHDLLDYLEVKFNVLKDQFNEDGYLYLSIIDNKFYKEGSCGGESTYDPSPVDKILNKYYGNALTKSLSNENQLTYLLNKNIPVNPTFVEDLFLNSCLGKNINSTRVLLIHEKTKYVINSSEVLNGYLNEPTENKEFKNDIKVLINSLYIKDKLDSSLVDKTTTAKKVKL